ncbi:MAG TPA: hypothetical protein VNH22_06760 [Blastocatellia bacterium]|nr:hypothetical protein [Blastocatellia bacterium]
MVVRRDERQAPTAPGTQRLFYLTSRLNTQGTHIKDWKLLIASARRQAERRAR